MTLLLLWQEYNDGQPDGYQYTQFLRHFRAWQKVSRPPTMRQIHRAGEALEVDYAGMTLTVMDMGLPREAQVFVACLPCSNLVYAETTWTQGQEDWLGSHVRALTAIGGCPEKLVPDNLKSGVTDAWYYDPGLNRAYYDLAQHYGIAIVPARVRRPRDKSSVESAVKHVERWRLLDDLAMARAEGKYARLLAQVSKVRLLILDDWLMVKLTGEQRRDLLEVIDDRHQRGSTILATQVPVERWHDQIADPTYADAILDRLVHNAHRIELHGRSMRGPKTPEGDKTSANTELTEVIPDIHPIHSSASSTERKT